MSWMDALDGIIDGLVKRRRIQRRGPRPYDNPEWVEQVQRTGIRFSDQELTRQWHKAWAKGDPPLWSYNEYKRAEELDRPRRTPHALASTNEA